MFNFIQTPIVNGRTLLAIEPLLLRRPGCQFNLPTGTHPGVRCPRSDHRAKRNLHGHNRVLSADRPLETQMEKVALLCMLIAIISVLAELSPDVQARQRPPLRKPLRSGPFKSA
jgi:hypothetical protein